MARGIYGDGTLHHTKEYGPILVMGSSKKGVDFRLVKFLDTEIIKDLRLSSLSNMKDYKRTDRRPKYGRIFKTKNSGDLMTIPPLKYTSEYNSKYMDVKFINTGNIRRGVTRSNVYIGRVLDTDANINHPRYRRNPNGKYSIGTRHESNNYGTIEIIGYDKSNALRREIKFLETGHECNRTISCISSGKLQDDSITEDYNLSKFKVGYRGKSLRYGEFEIIKPKDYNIKTRDIKFPNTGYIGYNIDVNQIYNGSVVDDVMKELGCKYGVGRTFKMSNDIEVMVVSRCKSKNYRFITHKGREDKPIGEIHINNLKTGKWPRELKYKIGAE